jgi:hypothetical protein
MFYIQRCSIFSEIGFAVKITDVNSDAWKIHSDLRSGIICFISDLLKKRKQKLNIMQK